MIAEGRGVVDQGCDVIDACTSFVARLAHADFLTALEEFLGMARHLMMA